MRAFTLHLNKKIQHDFYLNDLSQDDLSEDSLEGEGITYLECLLWNDRIPFEIRSRYFDGSYSLLLIGNLKDFFTVKNHGILASGRFRKYDKLEPISENEAHDYLRKLLKSLNDEKTIRN